VPRIEKGANMEILKSEYPRAKIPPEARASKDGEK
jgi:hypothetical protein